MVIIKFILLGIILGMSMLIGINIAKRYSTRVLELKEVLRALNMFEEKIKFTYEPIPDVFEDISKNTKNEVSKVFEEASINMKTMYASEAWELAVNNSNTKMSKEDLDIIKGLSKLLGRTDLDGQVSEIRLTKKFIETKIEEAELERAKNNKLYKTLGATIGLAIVIVLI